MLKLKKEVILVMLVLISLTWICPGLAKPVYAAKSELVRSDMVADIAEASSSKVVWIITTYPSKPSNLPPNLKKLFEEEQIPSQGMGSGFFFNAQGYILTNAHVVQNASNIEVLLKDEKQPVPASLIGLDKELDIAVLKIEPKEPKSNYPYLKIGDSDSARIGEWVVAIGNPYGLDHTVTLGIISAKSRPINIGTGFNQSQSYENMIQTDAAINPGNSGGPLLNLAGEVIGINTAVSMTGQGLGFAIPINSVTEILDELITNGKISRPWLGVMLIDLKALDSQTKDYLKINRTDGVLLKPIPDSPAAKAGIRQFDLLVEINHEPVTGPGQAANYIRSHTKVGDTVRLLIIRNGAPIVIEAQLAEKP